jgi:hypothetical protein
MRRSTSIPILDWLNLTFNPAAVDPSQLGLGLLLLIAIGVPLLILFMALVVWMLKSSWSFLVSLIVAFLLFNVIAVGGTLLWAYASFDTISGLFWFLVKVFTFAFIFVWMRRHTAARAHRPAHGLGLEVAG